MLALNILVPLAEGIVMFESWNITEEHGPRPNNYMLNISQCLVVLLQMISGIVLLVAV